MEYWWRWDVRESLSRLGLPHTDRKLEIMGRSQAGRTVQCPHILLLMFLVSSLNFQTSFFRNLTSKWELSGNSIIIIETGVQCVAASRRLEWDMRISFLNYTQLQFFVLETTEIWWEVLEIIVNNIKSAGTLRTIIAIRIGLNCDLFWINSIPR